MTHLKNMWIVFVIAHAAMQYHLHEITTITAKTTVRLWHKIYQLKEEHTTLHE